MSQDLIDAIVALIGTFCGMNIIACIIAGSCFTFWFIKKCNG